VYFRFLWNLLKVQATGVARANAFAAGFKFTINVVCRAKAASCVPLWFGRLRELLSSDDLEDGRLAAEWLIQYLGDEAEGRDSLLQMLMYCPSQVSRRELISLILEAIKVLQPHLTTAYLQVVEAEFQLDGRNSGTTKAFGCSLTRLLAYILILVQECTGGQTQNPLPGPAGQGNMRAASPLPVTTTAVYMLTPEIPRLLTAVAQLSEHERVLLLWLGAVPRFGSFITSLNGGENRGLMHTAAGEEALALSMRLLEVLVGTGHAGPCHHFSTRLCQSPTNLQAVVDRSFVEMAVVHHPEVR